MSSYRSEIINIIHTVGIELTSISFTVRYYVGVPRLFPDCSGRVMFFAGILYVFNILYYLISPELMDGWMGF